MKFRIYQDFRGNWRWYLTGENGERLATGEAHKSRSGCEEDIAETKSSGTAALEDPGETALRGAG